MQMSDKAGGIQQQQQQPQQQPPPYIPAPGQTVPVPQLVGVWMQRPLPINGCPAGLEYLSQLDKLMVHQEIEFLNVLVGWESNNRFSIKNSQGQQLYYALENTDMCERFCCGSQRGFTIHIVDNMGVEVLKISRDLKPFAGCCWCAGILDCCSHVVQIEGPPGTILGYVKQTGSFWKMGYDVLDENFQQLTKIRGPCCILNGPCCPCDVEFRVLDLNEAEQWGSVTRVYSNFLQEAFTKATNFELTFPLNMPVKTKSLLMGALFLIDFMFYERNPNQNNN